MTQFASFGLSLLCSPSSETTLQVAPGSTISTWSDPQHAPDQAAADLTASSSDQAPCVLIRGRSSSFRRSMMFVILSDFNCSFGNL